MSAANSSSNLKVVLVGTGCGTRDTMTERLMDLLSRADLVVGARRLVKSVRAIWERDNQSGKRSFPQTVEAYEPHMVLASIQHSGCKRCVVVYSGDTGFYSGARTLLPLLQQAGIDVQVFPGISSVQFMASQLGVPWQDWRLVSAHGLDVDVVAEVCHRRDVFFLTGSNMTPAMICQQLVDAGLGDLRVAVGEKLSYPTQRIEQGTAGQLVDAEFDSLAVMLVQAAPTLPHRVHGIADEEFQRAQVPMTKQEVRSVVLSKLAVRPDDVCWDVGAGTGSVSVEMALHARQVWAVEKNPEAVELARRNRQKFCAWNLRVLQGEAPRALKELPAPDAVFVGGSSGNLDDIVSTALEANPHARICVTSIALETLQAAMVCFEAHGIQADVCQVSVSRSKKVANLNMLMAQNPIFVISGCALDSEDAADDDEGVDSNPSSAAQDDSAKDAR